MSKDQQPLRLQSNIEPARSGPNSHVRITDVRERTEANGASHLDQPIFGSHLRETTVGEHNVAHLIPLSPTTQEYTDTEAHYAERGTGQLAYAKREYMVSPSTKRAVIKKIEDQMSYMNDLTGRNVAVITRDEVSGLSVVERPLVVLYSNIPHAVEGYERANTEVWGLPPKFVSYLKNKANFFELVRDLAVPGVEVPDFEVVDVENVAAQAEKFRKKTEQSYKNKGLPEYPADIILKAAEGDGGYGTIELKEVDGQILVVVNGKAKNAKPFLRWDEALAFAQVSLKNGLDPDKDTRIVINRLIDLEPDSPGRSDFIMDNLVTPSRWNGQLQKPGSKACVGTNTYQPSSDYLKRNRDKHEQSTAMQFEEFLRKAAAKMNIPFEEIRGVINQDLMFPGKLERKYRKALGLVEDTPYTAEANTRWTNATEAEGTIIRIKRMPQTIASFQKVAEEGFQTIDNFNFPARVDPRDMRDAVIEADRVASDRGVGRIITRMTVNPMGLIMTGNMKEIAEIANQIIQKKVGEPIDIFNG